MAATLHNSVDLLCGTTAAELLHNSVDLLCVTLNGRRATQLDRFTLCGTTAAELHNLVNLLRGTTAIELLHNSVGLLCGTKATKLNNPVSLMHAPGITHIFQRH